MRRMVIFFDCEECDSRCWVEAKYMAADPETVKDLIAASFDLEAKGLEIHDCNSEADEDDAEVEEGEL